MMSQRLIETARKSIQKNIPDLNAFLRGNYPEFMFARNLQTIQDEIPVFVYHSVEPLSFESQLKFLKQNGYKTLVGNELFSCLSGKEQIQEKSIVLTFDDGLATLFSTAYPLLKKYGFRAICFIIPGLIPNSAPESPTYENRRNNVNAKELTSREHSEYPLCSWEEIREMHNNRVIDFQSHTMYHHQICISSKLIDFINPNFDYNIFGNINVPVYQNNGVRNYSRQVPLGTPIFRSNPRMAGNPELIIDESIRKECTDHVTNNGDMDYFNKPSWRKDLSCIIKEIEKSPGYGLTYETNETQTDEITEDLTQSKKIIESQLSGHIVDQLCYPWYLGSECAIQASKKIGYQMNYWGIVNGRPTNKNGCDLFYIPRIEEHYIYRLPGNGRKKLKKIIMKKLTTQFPRFIKRLNIN
ncbi:polysaccharide deacetylase family protein [candidate division KSB1 bacterium]|nr:polysaccharide deacetylase family protein [candidate division KSB1 bacterium]